MKNSEAHRLTEGCNETLAAFYRANQRRLGRFFGRRLPADRVDDAVQETVTRFISAIRRRTISHNRFEGWLFRTATFVALEQLRGSGRVRLSDELDRIPRIDASSEGLVESVDQMIAMLPVHLGTPLRLYVCDGFSHRCIAARLGLTRAAVTMRIHRARQVLWRRMPG